MECLRHEAFQPCCEAWLMGGLDETQIAQGPQRVLAGVEVGLKPTPHYQPRLAAASI